MKRINIKNFGPISLAEVELQRVNVIIGPQSSGKSCLLKVASCCSWIEKRIQRLQSYKIFESDGYFEECLIEFHKLDGYKSKDSIIEYESDYMRFSYNFGKKSFSFDWKKARWKYHSSKISYIPAERNMVSVIPNWFDVALSGNNIQRFMSDWNNARTSLKSGLDILNLDVNYHYDSISHQDIIKMPNDKELLLTNTSSGLQSLVPLYVHLNYMYAVRFRQKGKNSTWSKEQEDRKLQEHLMNEFQSLDGGKKTKVLKIVNNFTQNFGNDIFLEEPEQNLFPPTQSVLMTYLVDKNKGTHGGYLFIATHSPYVMTDLLEKVGEKELGLFLSQKTQSGEYKVKQASRDEIEEIYKYGVDVFFNIETYK